MIIGDRLQGRRRIGPVLLLNPGGAFAASPTRTNVIRLMPSNFPHDPTTAFPDPLLQHRSFSV
jgi:hypothetical protein